eukprot:CAMPEP_0116852826 /NCGR_PEP_ID=MMETSP0418-20121206/17534_1 /TAXON_ID=1158023 /ORGANISM="Astrosyne radiata, Strain 13vi08-1A" /LENGTH=260 /DNA_ID=CAMNT_0004485083 /DNA_START=100 /DNA_END=882 /DNA_ORIENTATION=-
MMQHMKMILLIAIAMSTGTSAFYGTAVSMRPFGSRQVAVCETASQRSGMVMRYAKQDFSRIQKYNKKLQQLAPVYKTARSSTNLNPLTAEKVESILLSKETSDLIAKCNAKLRRKLILKTRNVAWKVGVEVSSEYGVPMTHEELMAHNWEEGKVRKEAKKAKFDAVFAEMDKFQAIKKQRAADKVARQEAFEQRTAERGANPPSFDFTPITDPITAKEGGPELVDKLVAEADSQAADEPAEAIELAGASKSATTAAEAEA